MLVAGSAVALAGQTFDTAVADTLVVGDPGARDVSAYGGALLWSRKVTKTEYRLIQRVGGVTSEAPVRSFAHPIAPDLGPGKSGGVVAVYSRCKNSVVTVMTNSCDVYALNLHSGNERKLNAVSISGCAETSPSTWSGTVAFVRSGMRSCRPGLYLRRPGKTPTRLAKHANPDASGSPFFHSTDVRESVVVAVLFIPGFATNSEDSLQLWSPARSSTKPCEIASASSSSIGGINSLEDPVLDGDSLYWAFTTNPATPGPQSFNRARARCKTQVESAERGRSAIGPLGVDAGTIYYVSGQLGIFIADDPPPTFVPIPPLS